MPYLPDAFREIREVEAFNGRQATANERARSLTQVDVARIDRIAEMYPHLSPDSLMALGRTGLDPNSPQVFQVAEIEARKMVVDHPGGRSYGAPSITPGQRREATDRNNMNVIPSWRPQSGNPGAIAAWDEARRSGLVVDGILTRPDGPDWERLGDTYNDVLDRLTQAGEEVPVMALEGEDWHASIARRRPQVSAAEQMHAGHAEAGRQALHIDFQRIEPDQVPTQGGGQFGGKAGAGLVGNLPGTHQRAPIEGAAAQADVAGALRQAAQGAFAGMDFGIQELQGQVRNIYGATHGRNVNWLQPQSDIGIALTSPYHDMGNGFFVDQESEVAQERRRREAERGQIGGHNVTLGRWVADAAPFATDSKPSLILSGLVDFGAQMADPTAWALGKGGEAAEARTLFRAADVAGEESAGMIRGLRNVIDSPTAASWLDSPEGQARLISLANERSPYRIWRGMNRKVTFDFARQLADEALTPEDARRLLEPQLGTNIRKVSTVSMPRDPFGGFRDPFRAAGAPGQMPLRGPIDAWKKDVVGGQIEEWLHNINATDDEIAAHVDRVARAEDPIHLNAAIRETLRSSDGILAREGVADPKLRGKLVAISQTAHEEASNTYKAIESAQTPTYNDAIANGVPVHDAGANLYVEHAPRHLTLPDARNARRAISRYNRILANPDTAELRLGFSILDHIQNDIWKPVQLITRIAWPIRVIGEEQIRMAAAGYDSVFRHPMSFIAWGAGRQARGEADNWLRVAGERLQHDIRTPGDLLGRKGQTGVTGQAIDEMNEFKDTLVRGNGSWVDRAIASPGKTTYTKVNAFRRKEYVDSWASNILRVNSDPVAQHLLNSASLDETKRWFSEGGGLKYKGGLAAAHPAEFATRAQADAYIEIVAQRAEMMHGGNVGIGDILRTGRHAGRDIFDGDRIDPNFIKHLDTLADDFGPESVVGDLPGVRGGWQDRMKNATDKMFSVLMTERTNNLSRSRTFKQAYWKEAQRLTAFSTEDTKQAILRAAEDANLSNREIKRIRNTVARGNLELDDVDMIAKGHGLDTTRELLYDLSRRGRKMDAMRLVFPFGEAWSEVMTRWFGTGALGGDTVGLLWKRPKTIRRFQQLMQGARGEDFGKVMGAPEGQGFFWKNGFGEEVFIYPGSQFLTQHTVGVPVPLSGRVQGLSMFGTVMPGLGLVAQIPVGWFMQAKPGPQAFKHFLNEFEDIGIPLIDSTVREQILPFGSVGAEDQGAITDISNFIPPWMRNGLQALTEGDMRPDAYASDVMDTAAYLRTTGRYGDDIGSQQQLLEDAQKSARGLYFIRTLAGFAAPASPDFEFMVENDQGKLLRLAALRDEFFGMLDEDPRTAGQTFLDKYGPDIHAVVATPQTTSSRLGTPMDRAGVAWVMDNPGIEDRLPYTYGMFAPTGGPDDFSLYRDELSRNQRDRLDPQTWVRLLNNTKGNMVMSQARAQIQGNPNKAQSAWLRRVGDALREEYPGYGDTTGRLEGTEIPTFVAELERAANDPAVRDTDAGAGLRLYLQARDKAMANAEAAGLTGGFAQADSMGGTRVWLNDVAAAIIDEHPSFEPLWQNVFSREAEMEQ